MDVAPPNKMLMSKQIKFELLIQNLEKTVKKSEERIIKLEKSMERVRIFHQSVVEI